ncbi:hypothetical protein DO021_08300 [Desulfobacter hydrogenophilus]|uniref:Uncharacterized protein n=1 Tax=Desulfobacter hydrogenophilus TaxID=2291 RepID=A0A328FH89_9BACT|nr:hypothetical protein DO021_08300 [Desulfobacter hydrogenophilus]
MFPAMIRFKSTNFPINMGKLQVVFGLNLPRMKDYALLGLLLLDHQIFREFVQIQGGNNL